MNTTKLQQQMKLCKVRRRRDKSTKYFTVIEIEDLEQKSWKKTDKWREPWF